MNDYFLEKKLNERRQLNSVRSLSLKNYQTDFCSNDYLGIVKNKLIENKIKGKHSFGSTGSRLLSGNYPLIEETEKLIANFHNAPAGLIFNSGYDANVGLLASVPQKGDIIIYDQLSHASIRDGIRLSFANSYPFFHNNANDLEKKLASAANHHQNIFVVTESVFSMDGDMAPLLNISGLCEKYNAALIVDEAHATGVVGKKGEGLVQLLNLEEKCFARIHTFGKACGCHGAIVLGSSRLKEYMVNFSRPFIYSTSLPPATVAAIKTCYTIFPQMHKERAHIEYLIEIFRNFPLQYTLLNSHNPIQVVVIPGNEAVKKVAFTLQENKLDVRPILYPTVPKGKERLRIVFHSFNTIGELKQLTQLLSK
jgi:8-amino-7-oxononanoate synthase